MFTQLIQTLCVGISRGSRSFEKLNRGISWQVHTVTDTSGSTIPSGVPIADLGKPTVKAGTCLELVDSTRYAEA